MKLMQKLLLGFGIVVVLVLILGAVGIIGLGKVVGSGEQTIGDIQKSQFLDQKLNDHLLWMDKLTNQLLNDVEFNAQTDWHKCGFGTWYYGIKESEEYAKLSPEEKKVFDEMEQYHIELHESGQEIKELYSPTDLTLDGFLAEKEGDHLKWMMSLMDTWEDNNKVFTSTTDPRKCGFGQWYYSFIGSEDYNKFPPEIRKAFDDMESIHSDLHHSAEGILALAGPDGKIHDPESVEKAKQIFITVTEPRADEMLKKFAIVRAYIKEQTEKKQKSMEVFQTKSEPAVEHMMTLFGEYKTIVDEEAKKSQDNTKSQQAGTRALLVIFVVICGALAMVIGVFFALMITRPVNKTVAILKDIAEGEGDLTRRMNVKSKDEIGEMGKWFDKFMGNMNAMIVRISKNAASSAATAEELSASSEQVNASTEQVSSTVQEIAKGSQQLSKSAGDTKNDVEQLVSSIKTVTNSAMESAKKAIEAKDAATKGGESAKLAGEKMQSISESVSSSAAVVQDLGSKSEQINKVVEVINSISEQTNLLALNAAIEAARAGEAGRGFAVVADEVRKLAEESQKATKQIEAMISEIVSSTKNAVDSMSKGKTAVDEGNKVVGEALNALQVISQNVAEVASQVEMISGATQQQLVSSEKVQKSIEGVSAVAEESAAGSEEVSASVEQTTASMQQVATSAQNLAKSADDLKRLVGKFKVDESGMQDEPPAAPASPEKKK